MISEYKHECLKLSRHDLPTAIAPPNICCSVRSRRQRDSATVLSLVPIIVQCGKRRHDAFVVIVVAVNVNEGLIAKTAMTLGKISRGAGTPSNRRYGNGIAQ